MSEYGYDDQIDQLLFEVPEAMAIAERSADSDGHVIPYVLVQYFGGFVDSLLGGHRYRGISRTAAEACLEPADVIRRACGVLEAWATDDTPGVHDLLGAGFLEAFDEEGLER